MGVTVLLLCLLPVLAFADNTQLDKAASDAVNSFSVNLFKDVLKESPGNVAMSPVSVSVLLAILHQGASGNTQQQLSQALQSEPEQSRAIYKTITHSLQNVSNGTLLEFANAIFLNTDYLVLPQFKQHLEEFLAQIDTVDFSANSQAAQHINSWVSERTHNKLENFLEPDMVSSMTRLVLVNAIYFKDLWMYPFEPEETLTETFYAEIEKQVPMMHLERYFKIGRLGDVPAQSIQLPFQGERFSMVLVLPDERNGLQKILTQLTSNHISQLLSDWKQRYPQIVTLSMPKFKLSTELRLIPFLETSMPDLFNPNANFSGVSNEAIYISEAIQKAEIEVDELGATATAATGFGSAIGGRPSYPSFRANHPFLLFIVDDVNDVILFAGKVSDPSHP